MVTLHSSTTQQEQERILATFKAGHAMCKAALLTLLYAMVTFLLSIIHIATFLINFSIGVLTCLYAVVCMVRLLLVQCQELLENPLNTIGGKNRWI